MSIQQLPTRPGVFEFLRVEPHMVERVQLDEDGNWWPYPYLFSGWRESELKTFDAYNRIMNLIPDAPNGTVQLKIEHQIAEEEAKTLLLLHDLQKSMKKTKKLYKRLGEL